MPTDEMVEKARKVVAAIEDANDRSHGAATAWCPDEAVELIAAALEAAEDAVPGPSEDVIAAITHPRGPLWWEQELTRHWGEGHSSHDTRRAAKVACNLVRQVRASPPSEASREAIRKEAFEEAAVIGYRVCAETRHVTLGDKVEAAIRAMVDIEDLAKRVISGPTGAGADQAGRG